MILELNTINTRVRNVLTELYLLQKHFVKDKVKIISMK